jgi:anti-sigma B factor antagonist
MDSRPPAPATQAPPIVRLAPEIDITNSGRVYADLEAACVPGVGAVIADMTQTTFCDSSGIRALIQVHNLAGSRRVELSLVVTSDSVLRILALCGLNGILHLYSSTDDAVASWRRRGGATPPQA